MGCFIRIYNCLPVRFSSNLISIFKIKKLSHFCISGVNYKLFNYFNIHVKGIISLPVDAKYLVLFSSLLLHHCQTVVFVFI